MKIGGPECTFFSWTGRLSARRQLVRLIGRACLWVVSGRQVLKGQALCVVVLLTETALLLLLPGVAGRSTALRVLATTLLWKPTRLLLEALLWCSVPGLTAKVALCPKVALTTSVWLPRLVTLTTALRWLIVA